MRTKQEIKHAFTPVGKLDPGATQRILRVQILLTETAQELADLVPESADRTAAMRKLLEVKMTCVQAISHAIPVPVQPAKSTAAPQSNKDSNVKNQKEENKQAPQGISQASSGEVQDSQV